MKIIFSWKKDGANWKALGWTMKNPEYSWLYSKDVKRFLGGRLIILKRKKDNVVKRAKDTLLKLNYSIANNFGEITNVR